MQKKVFGLVGPIASGKGTVAKILEEKGYRIYSLSDVLKDEVKKRGLEVTRLNCNIVSNDLRGSLGADILARRTAEIVKNEDPEYVVIDAIRNPKEIEFLREEFDIKIIGVIADQKKRFEMFRSRGTYKDELQTFEEFRKFDDLELKQEGEHKQQTKACLDMAEITIENNGTVEELLQRIEQFITAS
jgi:dephospho-CoA kinase